MLAAPFAALFRFYEQDLQQVQTEARASTTKSTLRMKL
jgi:hypothetical protein